MVFKKNDTYPPLTATLVDSAGDPVDLTDATVKFRMVDASGAVVVSAGTVSITNALAGEVSYSWAAGDVDTVGEYRGEFSATLFGGGKAHFPNDGYIDIRIIDELPAV